MTILIPPAIKCAIDTYVETGRLPGSFVQAVLRNNLRDAVGYADSYSLEALRDIVGYCIWEIPGACWGTPEKIAAWQEKVQQETVDELAQEIFDGMSKSDRDNYLEREWKECVSEHIGLTADTSHIPVGRVLRKLTELIWQEVPCPETSTETQHSK